MSTVKNTSVKVITSSELGITLGQRALSPKTYACSVRVLLQNWRQGTVGHKTRGQVAFSTRKPWRQKGTGRARAGSARSPLWRKGGVIFGPEPRVRTLKIHRKQRRLTCKDVFQSMIESGAIYSMDFDVSSTGVPRTKEVYNVLKSAGFESRKGMLFLPYDDANNFAAFRNIPAVSIMSFDQPNVFDLSGTRYWMFLEKDLELFKGMVEKWI